MYHEELEFIVQLLKRFLSFVFLPLEVLSVRNRCFLFSPPNKVAFNSQPNNGMEERQHFKLYCNFTK